MATPFNEFSVLILNLNPLESTSEVIPSSFDLDLFISSLVSNKGIISLALLRSTVPELVASFSDFPNALSIKVIAVPASVIAFTPSNVSRETASVFPTGGGKTPLTFSGNFIFFLKATLALELPTHLQCHASSETP